MPETLFSNSNGGFLPHPACLKIKKGNTKSENGVGTNLHIPSKDCEPEVLTISISVPGLDPFELQVSSQDQVQDLHHAISEHPQTFSRTCFSLHFNGQQLDNYSQLSSLDGFVNGAEVRLLEEPYSIREARNHVRHVYEVMRSVDLSGAYLGRDQMSLSFVNTITGGSILEVDEQPQWEHPAEFLLPGGRASPQLTPLHPLARAGSPPRCLHRLAYSGWNPSPSYRSLHGDLLYLFAHTLEDRLHITACPRGFYLNQSTEEEFVARPASQPFLSHSLVELLSQASPGFRRGWEILRQRRARRTPLEQAETPYQVHSWLSPRLEHGIDAVLKEDAFCSKMAYEENLPGQTRDWNAELQRCRELPRSSRNDRLARDRAMFRGNTELVAAATRAASSVVNGNIMAINPGEQTRQQMFIWNNMFFSMGFDVKDHYKDFGGDDAAFAATLSDLNGVRAYSNLDIPGLHTLGTTIIDFRGFRVTAQTIIPGILEREQEDSVVYGSIDFGKSIVSHEKYTDLLTVSAKKLRIRPHHVTSQQGKDHRLFSSVECKGIIGNDGRPYVLDLLRTFPPDTNLVLNIAPSSPPTSPASPVEGGKVEESPVDAAVDSPQLSSRMRQLGFPWQHRHAFATLRPEFLDAFVDARYSTFLRTVSQKLRQHQKSAPLSDTSIEQNGHNGLNGSEEGHRDPATPLAVKQLDVDSIVKLVGRVFSGEEKDSDVVRHVADAALECGSSSSDCFEVVFNPDVYQPHVKHPESENTTWTRDEDLVRAASEYLILEHIPIFVTDCLEQNLVPQDSLTLTELLHKKGINMRYLGRVVQVLKSYPALSYLYNLSVCEIVLRSVNHLYRAWMQEVDSMSLAVAVSHLLNCFLSSCPQGSLQQEHHHHDTTRTTKKKNKKKGKHTRDVPEITPSWGMETSESLWSKICQEAQDYFHFTLPFSDIDNLCETLLMPRVTLLRAFCHRAGLQLALREYFSETRHRSPFTEDDVINLVPVVKYLEPRANDGSDLLAAGQAEFSRGHFEASESLLTQALPLLSSVLGPLHPQLAAGSRLLAQVSYLRGKLSTALVLQHRATMIAERVTGVDSAAIAADYSSMSLYCFACGQLSNAITLIFRSRHIALLCHGENHPDMARIDANIGLLLFAVGDLEKSVAYLNSALELNKKFFGPTSLKVALVKHILARVYATQHQFQSALDHENDAHIIYINKLGTENTRTIESGAFLGHVTSCVSHSNGDNNPNNGVTQNGSDDVPSQELLLQLVNLVNGVGFVCSSDEVTLKKDMTSGTTSKSGPKPSIESQPSQHTLPSQSLEPISV